MSITPKGMSVLELYRLYRKNQLIVNRRYQRKLVWTKKEKASLIESILRNYPIPLILFGKFNQSEEMYEIIDGMQRLNSIFSFIENEFSVQEKFFDVTQHPLANQLSKSGVFKPEETEESNLFEPTKCANFLEYSMAVTIYEAKSGHEIEDIFNRINSNGKHLSPQEVRQAGVTTTFAELVKKIASEIRGDDSEDKVNLTKMPAISIDSKSFALGYGVLAEDTFWCNQGIINPSLLRDSEDEELIADIVLSIALDEPFQASKDNYDRYYGKGAHDKANEIDLAINKYGKENLRQDIKNVFSKIINAIKLAAGESEKNYLRKKLNPSGGGNPVKEPFYTLFMAFYELIIKESKDPFDCKQIFDAVYELKSKIKINKNTKDRRKNINLTKGLIEKYFKHLENPTRSSGSYAIDLENYLKRSKIEAPYYDFKQGLYLLNDKNRNLDEKIFDKICQNIAAMANLGKNKTGYLFIGVSDKESDTKRIEKLDNITAPRIHSFGIVGLDREASIKGCSLNDYTLLISRKISESKLPEWLKISVNTNLTFMTYSDRTVLMISVKAGDEPAWYGDKLYIRDGHEKKEVSGEQIAAVYNLFK